MHCSPPPFPCTLSWLPFVLATRMSKSRRSLIIVKHGSYLRFSLLPFSSSLLPPCCCCSCLACLLSAAVRQRWEAPSAVQTCIQLQCILLSLPRLCMMVVCMYVWVCKYVCELRTSVTLSLFTLVTVFCLLFLLLLLFVLLLLLLLYPACQYFIVAASCICVCTMHTYTHTQARIYLHTFIH